MDGQKEKLGSLEQSVKEYVNLRVDEYKYKGVENFSIISNKTLVVLVAVMLGAVILQLAGFAVAFMIGELVGSTAAGFGITALLFAIGLVQFRYDNRGRFCLIVVFVYAHFALRSFVNHKTVLLFLLRVNT